MSKDIILKFLNCQSCTIFFFIEYEKSASLHSPRPPLALAFREVLTFTSIRMETHKIAIPRLGRGLDLPLCKNISNFLKCQWSLETSSPPREIQEKFSLPGVFYEDLPEFKVKPALLEFRQLLAQHPVLSQLTCSPPQTEEHTLHAQHAKLCCRPTSLAWEQNLPTTPPYCWAHWANSEHSADILHSQCIHFLEPL